MFSPPLLIALACLGAKVFASTTISTYSDSDCTDFISLIDGPETGECQENTLGSYTSFSVITLDSLCAVTFYVGDVTCNSTDRWSAPVEKCYTNTSITQFSVDCSPAIEASASSAALLSSSSSSSQSLPSSRGAVSSESQSSTKSPAISMTTSIHTTSAASATVSTPVVTGGSAGSSNSGLSAKQTINLEVILPTILGVITIMVAIVFGVRHWNSSKQKPNL